MILSITVLTSTFYQYWFCFTPPTLILTNVSVILILINLISFYSKLNSFRELIRFALWILSYTFLKTIKRMRIFLLNSHAFWNNCLRMNIWAIVDLSVWIVPDSYLRFLLLFPLALIGCNPRELCMLHLEELFSNTLQSCLFLFLCIGHNTPRFHSAGNFSFVHARQISFHTLNKISFPSFFSSSTWWLLLVTYDF